MSEVKRWGSILIDFDDEHEYEHTIEEVLRLVKEGYSSGLEPTFEMIKNEEFKDE